jgi:hypothetical protein
MTNATMAPARGKLHFRCRGILIVCDARVAEPWRAPNVAAFDRMRFPAFPPRIASDSRSPYSNAAIHTA